MCTDKSFGAYLRTLRKNAKLTQEELVDRADTQSSYISAVETGSKHIGSNMAIRIGVALELKSAEFEAFMQKFLQHMTLRCIQKVERVKIW